MSDNRPYPIGTPGTPWSAAEKSIWLSRQSQRRSYAAEVLSQVEALRARFEVVEYGRLDHDPARYPLLALKSRAWRAPAMPADHGRTGRASFETFSRCGIGGADVRVLDGWRTGR